MIYIFFVFDLAGFFTFTSSTKPRKCLATMVAVRVCYLFCSNDILFRIRSLLRVVVYCHWWRMTNLL